MHFIIINQGQLTDSGGGQIQRRRGSQPAEAGDHRMRLFEFQLTFRADILQQQLAAVAHKIMIIQHGLPPDIQRLPRSVSSAAGWQPASQRL